MIKNSNINQMKNRYHENKLSHIFLIETNNKEMALNDVLQIIKYINCPKTYEEECQKCNICHLIESNTLPTLFVIYPDGQAIKKSQMEELKFFFTHKPYVSKYNTYVINDAEKFNASSANTILKFIEEPEENIIGFLITNNKENVISTIKSRCELIKCYYEEKSSEILNEELFQKAISYIYDVEIIKNKSILINKKIIDSRLDKNQMIQFFQIILQIYLDLLNGSLHYTNLNKLKTLSVTEIIQRIQLINEIIDKLNYNVNINLLLDYYVLSLED